MLSRLALVVAVCAGVCIGQLARGGVASTKAAGPPLQTEAPARRRGTILLVGVYHAPEQFRGEKFSPAHIRAALEAFRPEVVGVESNPEWFARGRFYLATYEAQNVAVPWARRHGVPVYGIDWIGDLGDKDYAGRQRVEQVRRVRADADSARLSPSSYRYGLADWGDLQTPEENAELDFDALNGPALGEKWVKWLDEGKHRRGSPQEYMEERDNHIVEHIVAAAGRHAGARVAVVIGAAHRGDLERKLRARGFEVVGPAGVAGSARESGGRRADDLLTAEDIAAILYEAWDSTPRPGVTRERAERLLARLQSLAGEDPRAKSWGEYFAARRLMLGGDMAGARAAFERIAAGAAETRSPFPGSRWRSHLTLRQSALLELGRIADLQGRRGEAVGHYGRLLASLKAPAYSEDYHSDYLFLATARNAVRALTLAPYTKAAGAEADARETASAAPPDSGSRAGDGLLKALEMSRAGEWAAAAALVEETLRGPEATHRERCEGHVIAAGAYARARKDADSRRHLTKFDAECGDLSPEHWVFRERKKLGGARGVN
ncbi:MAG TPA: hypothetical protein VF668_03010 [Pyrinomonadaceae bacterium]